MALTKPYQYPKHSQLPIHNQIEAERTTWDLTKSQNYILFSSKMSCFLSREDEQINIFNRIDLSGWIGKPTKERGGWGSGQGAHRPRTQPVAAHDAVDGMDVAQLLLPFSCSSHLLPNIPLSISCWVQEDLTGRVDLRRGTTRERESKRERENKSVR